MHIYKDYDQAALDRQYNNRLQTPRYAVHLQRWSDESRQTEKEFPFIHDIAYGEMERERLDIFPSPQPGSKTLVFIHGGYWQRLDKSDFQFIARAFHPLGITTVLLTYPLAPAASMDQIVTSCSKAMQWVYTNITRYNGNPDLLYLAGHSAGAHLVAMLMTTYWQQNIIKGAAALSGLFNLLPIMLSDINEVLNLDKEMTDRNSPVHLQPSHRCPLVLAVGGDETGEFKAQSKELYDRWKEKGVPVTFIEMPGINHYSIVEALADNTSALCTAMIRMMR